MGVKSWSLQMLLCLEDTIQRILMACRFQIAANPKMRGETLKVCVEHSNSSTDDKMVGKKGFNSLSLSSAFSNKALHRK